jgi:hypothetical protein
LLTLLNTLTADVAQVNLLALGSGLTETRLSGSIGADVTLLLARANVDGAGIKGVEVRGLGRLVGEREVGLGLGDLLVVGLSHFD